MVAGAAEDVASRPQAEASSTLRRLLLIAAAGGAIAALVTPPTDVYPAILVGLGLLAFAIEGVAQRGGFWRGAALGLAWGAAGQLIGMRFVPSVIMMFTDLGAAAAVLAHVLLSIGQSFHWAIGMGAAVLLRRHVRAPLELALGSGVLVALSIPSIFVWSPAGLLSPWPVTVQWAEWIGERGVSVLFAVMAALGMRSVVTARRRRGYTHPSVIAPAAGAVLLAAVMLISGHLRMRAFAGPSAGPTARVALVYAGIHPKDRWDAKNWPSILSTLRNATAGAETAGVDVSIWPEAAYPYPLPHDSLQAPTRRRQIIGGAVKGPILFGFIARDAPVTAEDGVVEHNSFNAATIVMPDGRMLPSYDKMELLWFGETVPLGRHLPWLRRIFQRSGGLIPGRELRMLELPRAGDASVRMGVFNCYEDTLPSFGRATMATHSPNLLVNVTNDAWFMGTAEPELHLRLSAMRSIELRRDLVRSVNLGVPAWIDAAGVVRARADDPGPGFVLAQPALRDAPPTLYARFGDWPMWLLLAAGMAIARYRQRGVTASGSRRASPQSKRG